MNFRHFLRMAQWARNPPSDRRVALIFGVVAICVALAGLEWLGVFPDNFGFEPRGDRLKVRPLP